ncbi:hypothetical protein P9133_01875 [Bacillus thuringiensis]|uniref:Uncharacterized protein n=1 Tax=Bacillus thuringiensis HD-771 TaxID=1218175 RepID=A0A9W3JGY0_BACTU|nr:hypothetical protein [Bacillus thuringiensis]AFQ19741.1 hypothetical protein BTG_32023 [Bacillus thuringiensis HD-771]MEC3263230.1 hypothetical protein [Bacillus thuringiensis]MEC3515730.1 hypothetical protein [Bacillus thuringiensis]MED2073544.1 hypothetical protein [Bacillus thuringiensis]MED2218329.1 hypothetical protein [Bacillus thuringiensis]
MKKGGLYISTLKKQCIYLKGTEPKLIFKSQEHIFPAGIGGIQKLPQEYVSHNANNAFSALELGFMRNSLIMLPRQFYGPGKRGNLSPKNATKSNVSLMEGVSDPTSIVFGYISLGKRYRIAQIKINVSNGECHFMFNQSTGDASAKITNFTYQLGKYDNKYSLYEDERFAEDEFVLGIHDNKWYLGLSNTGLVTKIQGYIKRILEQASFNNQTPQYGKTKTRVNQTIQIDEGYFRICGKIIFNYLAFAKGQDFVLREEFNPIRNWIVNGGEEHFATLLEKKTNSKGLFDPMPFPKKAHKLIISRDGAQLIAYISFYGDSFETIVHLCDNFEEPFEVEGFICNWEERKEYSLKEFLSMQHRN